MLKRSVSLLMGMALMVSVVGCASHPRTTKGAAIGGVIGAGAGALYGAETSSLNAGEGAVVGGLIGAFIGGIVGVGEDYSATAASLEQRINEKNDLLAEYKEKLRKCQAENTNLRDTIATLKRRIAELERQIAAMGGARVTYSLPSDVLFASGSAVLSSGGKSVLDKQAAKIKADYGGRKVQIEGHTDSDPIKTSGSSWKSNWELGAARALTVLHYLSDKHGIGSSGLSASTWADGSPVASNDSSAGKAKNRRTVIVLFTD